MKIKELIAHLKKEEDPEMEVLAFLENAHSDSPYRHGTPFMIKACAVHNTVINRNKYRRPVLKIKEDSKYTNMLIMLTII